MIRHWFNTREAEEIATELADHFAPRVDGPAALQDLLRRAGSDARLAALNFYKKARFANSFKWRLLENGVQPGTADQVTHSLVVHITQRAVDERPEADRGSRSSYAPEDYPDLLRRGGKALAGGRYEDAIKIYREVVDRYPTRADALNDLGAALCKVGEYVEAEQRFRESVSANPNDATAKCNLGNLLRWIGNMSESEVWLRLALKLNPNHVDARVGLGLTLTRLGRLRDARARFNKVLKTAPRHADALYGLGQIAMVEGRFTEAEALFKRTLEVSPKMPEAWARLALLRRMTPADSEWLQAAKELAASGVGCFEEVDLRFSIGKYYDDIDDFDQAFESFEAANGVLKRLAPKYDRQVRNDIIDAVIRAYPKDMIAAVGEGGSASVKPVFVVGMPRSGTSLTEQILASHPSINGAGELDFWTAVLREREAEVLGGLSDLATRQKLAEDYLQLLETHGGDSLRVIDKTPIYSDYLGTIYSVFPNARFIYMQRDPIDTCLSCYFQQFSLALNFSMDLSDLAHYYTGHRRLFEHWQSVLPAEKILVVPYEELVADQQSWTRKMLDFLGLDWSDRCLSFHETERSVVTASTWQVRQRLYTRSVGRWQEYKKFIGPLKALRS
jgi:tetratricopeptide (TPR) repeat protein